METSRVLFLRGELDRALREHPRSSAQSLAAPVAEALDSFHLPTVNGAIAGFLNQTAGGASPDHEVANGYALDHSGDASFEATNVATTG